MNLEKFHAAFEDEAFMKSLTEMKTAEEVVKAFGKKGISTTAAEVKELLKALQNGELDDSALEKIAGGWLSNMQQLGMPWQ